MTDGRGNHCANQNTTKQLLLGEAELCSWELLSALLLGSGKLKFTFTPSHSTDKNISHTVLMRSEALLYFTPYRLG